MSKDGRTGMPQLNNPACSVLQIGNTPCHVAASAGFAKFDIVLV
jgi:hypothetical protein